MRLALGLAFYMVVLIGAFAVHSADGFGAVLVAMPMLAFVLPQLVRQLDAQRLRCKRSWRTRI